MIDPTLPDPFHGNSALKDTTALPPGNVPELHKPALDALTRLVAAARASGGPTSLLVHGEQGSGKTHLIAQLRHDLRGDPAAVVVEVSLHGAYPGGLWRHTRKLLVRDLLCESGGNGSATGLTRLLAARYPQWGKVQAVGGLLDIIFPPTAPKLAPLMAADGGVPIALRAVLPKLYEAATATTAADWLRGEHLTDEALKVLGLPIADLTDQQQEVSAREVVLALCRLAGGKVTLVVCYDNLEAVQSSTADGPALRDFAWAAGELATEPGPRVVVTFVRPETMQLLRKVAEKAAVQRIAGTETEIPPLARWEHVARLVAARYEATPGWADVRKGHDDPHWPLGEPFLRAVLAGNRHALTPRHLLSACRVELDRIRKGKTSSTAEPAAAESQAVGFDRPWQDRRDRYLAKPATLKFDAVVGIGLPWLREAVGARFDRFPHPFDELPDVTLLFRPASGGKMIGVSVCSHPPQQFWRRLARLEKQWAAAREHHLTALVVVRRDGERIEPGGRRRWESLAAAGVAMLALPPQQYAELAAYQELFSLTQAGTFMDRGRPVTVAEFQTWAVPHLTSAVKELADAVFGPVPAPEQDLVPLVTAKPDRKPVRPAARTARV